MNAQTIIAIIGGILSMVQTLMPMLGTSGNATMVQTIIDSLIKIMPSLQSILPLLGNEAQLIYQGVKNIIGNLRSDSVVTTAQQDADLDMLDAQVDTAWDKVSPQFDPDFGKDSTGAA